MQPQTWGLQVCDAAPKGVYFCDDDHRLLYFYFTVGLCVVMLALIALRCVMSRRNPFLRSQTAATVKQAAIARERGSSESMTAHLLQGGVPSHAPAKGQAQLALTTDVNQVSPQEAACAMPLLFAIWPAFSRTFQTAAPYYALLVAALLMRIITMTVSQFHSGPNDDTKTDSLSIGSQALQYFLTVSASCIILIVFAIANRRWFDLYLQILEQVVNDGHPASPKLRLMRRLVVPLAFFFGFLAPVGARALIWSGIVSGQYVGGAGDADLADEEDSASFTLLVVIDVFTSVYLLALSILLVRQNNNLRDFIAAGFLNVQSGRNIRWTANPLAGANDPLHVSIPITTLPAQPDPVQSPPPLPPDAAPNFIPLQNDVSSPSANPLSPSRTNTNTSTPGAQTPTQSAPIRVNRRQSLGRQQPAGPTYEFDPRTGTMALNMSSPSNGPPMSLAGSVNSQGAYQPRSLASPSPYRSEGVRTKSVFSNAAPDAQEYLPPAPANTFLTAAMIDPIEYDDFYRRLAEEDVDELSGNPRNSRSRLNEIKYDHERRLERVIRYLTALVMIATVSYSATLVLGQVLQYPVWTLVTLLRVEEAIMIVAALFLLEPEHIVVSYYIETAYEAYARFLKLQRDYVRSQSLRVGVDGQGMMYEPPIQDAGYDPLAMLDRSSGLPVDSSRAGSQVSSLIKGGGAFSFGDGQGLTLAASSGGAATDLGLIAGGPASPTEPGRNNPRLARATTLNNSRQIGSPGGSGSTSGDMTPDARQYLVGEGSVPSLAGVSGSLASTSPLAAGDNAGATASTYYQSGGLSAAISQTKQSRNSTITSPSPARGRDSIQGRNRRDSEDAIDYKEPVRYRNEMTYTGGVSSALLNSSAQKTPQRQQQQQQQQHHPVEAKQQQLSSAGYPAQLNLPNYAAADGLLDTSFDLLASGGMSDQQSEVQSVYSQEDSGSVGSLSTPLMSLQASIFNALAQSFQQQQQQQQGEQSEQAQFVGSSHNQTDSPNRSLLNTTQDSPQTPLPNPSPNGSPRR